MVAAGARIRVPKLCNKHDRKRYSMTREPETDTQCVVHEINNDRQDSLIIVDDNRIRGGRSAI